MYQDRIIAFIDILGFGSLVEQSAADVSVQSSIRGALESVSPKKMQDHDWLRVNTDVIPPGELEEVKQMAALFVQAVRQEHPVAVSYFSDCIALSALSSDLLATQTILDLACKLMIRIWVDHGLVLRGGVTLGKLYHEDGGIIFGPAMNRAYALEKDVARYPRIVVDSHCLNEFKSQATFKPMESLIREDLQENLAFMSLASAFHYTLTSSTWTIGADDYYERCYQDMSSLIEKLANIRSSMKDEKIVRKYQWLIEESRRYVELTPRRIL